MMSSAIPTELVQARTEIDRIDRELIELLARRFAQTHTVGVLKATNSLQALDPNREAEKLKQLRELSRASGLNPDLITELFTRIMQEVVKNHKLLARNPAADA